MLQETFEQPIDPQAVSQPDWKEEYPKSREDAMAEVQRAQAAYDAWQLPPSWYPDTPEVTLADLYRERASVDNYVPKALPDFRTTKVPRGLEDWALKKIELAHAVWVANHRLHMYLTRISGEIDERYYKRPAEIKRENWDEVNGVMRGAFEIRVKNHKPEIILNDYGSLAKEIHERLEQRHKEWFERHKSDLLSRFPRISRFLELLSSAKASGVKFRLPEDVYWFMVDRMAALYVLEHPLDQSKEQHV